MVQLFQLEGDLGVVGQSTLGAESNKDLPTTRTDNTDISATVKGGDSDVRELTWSSADLSNADWPNGDYKGGFEIGAIGGNSSYKIELLNQSAPGTIRETLGISASQNSTGPFLFTVNIDPGAGATTDFFTVALLSSRLASHGNETTTVTINDVDSLGEVPFDAPVGGFAHSQAVVIG